MKQNIKKYGKRIASLFVAFVMLAAMLPTSMLTVHASDGITSTSTTVARTVEPAEGIDYDVQHVILQGYNDDGSRAYGWYINLSEERLNVPSGVTITGFSTSINPSPRPGYDPRRGTWTLVGNNNNPLHDANFQRLLNNNRNALHLHITTGNFDVSGRNRVPVDGAWVITFPPIGRRPASPRIAVNYSIFADATGATAGSWCVVSRERGADVTVPAKDGLEVGFTDAATGRVVDKNGFGQFSPYRGIAVRPIRQDERGRFIVGRYNYLIRTAPLANGDGTFTAASRPVRVRVTSELRPTRYRMNYRTEAIRLRANEIMFAGDLYAMHEGVQLIEVTENSASIRRNDLLFARRRTNISISNHLTTNVETIVMRRIATPRRAATAAQVNHLAPRATIEQYTILGVGGSLPLDRSYEILNPNRNRWGRLPGRIRASTAFQIRARPSIRRGQAGGTDIGFAASAAGNIEISHGVWSPPSLRNRTGIISATITPIDAIPPAIIGVSEIVRGVNGVYAVDVQATAGIGAVLRVTILEERTDAWGDVLTFGYYQIRELPEPDANGTLAEESIRRVVLETPIDEPHFIVRIELLDHQNQRNLADPYYCIKNTLAFSDFLSMDYEALKIEFPYQYIIDMSDGDNIGLMVVADADGLFKINAGEGGRNILTTTLNEYNAPISFTFSNIDSVMAAVRAGDNLVVVNGYELHVIAVRSISLRNPVVGGSVTLTSHDSFDLTDFFSHIHVRMESPVDDYPSPNSHAPFMSYNTGISPAFTLFGINGGVSRVVGTSPNTLSLNASVSVGVVLTTEAYFSVNWSWLVPTGINLFVRIGVRAEARLDANAEASSASPNGNPLTRTLVNKPVPLKMGFYGTLKVQLVVDWSATAEGFMYAKAYAEAGVIFNNGSFRTFTSHGAGFGYEFEGSATLSIGTKVTASLSWLGQVTANVWVHPRVEIQASAFVNTARPMLGDSHHMCNSCIRIAAYFVVDAGFSISYSIGVASIRFRGTIADKTFRDLIRLRLLELHWSLSNSSDSVFDGTRMPYPRRGACPNVGYRVTVAPQAVGYGVNPTPRVSIECLDYSRTVATWVGRGYTFLYNGDYRVRAIVPHEARTVRYEPISFSLASAPQVFNLSPVEYAVREPLYVVAPSVIKYSGDAIVLSYTGGGGDGVTSFRLARNENNAVRLDGDRLYIQNAGFVQNRGHIVEVEAVKPRGEIHLPGVSVMHRIYIEPVVLTAFIDSVSGLQSCGLYGCDYCRPIERLLCGDYISISRCMPLPIDQDDINLEWRASRDNWNIPTSITNARPEIYISRDYARGEATIRIDARQLSAPNHVIEPAIRYVLLTPSTLQDVTLSIINNDNPYDRQILGNASGGRHTVIRTWGDSGFSLNADGGRPGGDLDIQVVSGHDSGIVIDDDRNVSFERAGGTLVLRLEISGDDEYAPWVRHIDITVNPRDISDAVIALSGTHFYFNRNPHTPTVTSVTLGNRQLREGVDFDAPIYARNYVIGTATVMIHGIGNYTGTASANFNITRRAGSTMASRWNLSQVRYGFRSITLPQLSATPGTGQHVEYAISTSRAVPGTGWTTNPPSFGGRSNQTYYVFARTRGNDYFDAGQYVYLRIPHNGWQLRASGNVTNPGAGYIRFSADLYGNWGAFGGWIRVPYGSRGTRDTGWVSVGFAPWMVRGLIVEWDADPTRFNIGHRSKTMNPIQFGIRGNGVDAVPFGNRNLGTFDRNSLNPPIWDWFRVW